MLIPKTPKLTQILIIWLLDSLHPQDFAQEDQALAELSTDLELNLPHLWTPHSFESIKTGLEIFYFLFFQN